MPLCDASGAACLIPPPLPVAFRSCARCWCRLNLSADGVMCCVLTCRRSARCASCVFFLVRMCVAVWRLLSRAFTVDAVHQRWCASIR